MDQLELLLNLLANLLPGDIHEGCEMRKGDGLPAVLVGGDLGDDLGGDVTRRAEGVRLLNQGAGDNRAALEHILQIDQATVVHTLEVVVAVVEVNDAFLVRLSDFIRQKEPVGDVPAQLARYVIALGGQDCGVLVGVLLDDRFVDVVGDGESLPIQRAGVPQKLVFVAVLDVCFGDGVDALLHQLGLNTVLNLLHGDCPVELLVPERKPVGQPLGYVFLVFDRVKTVNLAQGSVCRIMNLGLVKADLSAVPFDDNHNARPPL